MKPARKASPRKLRRSPRTPPREARRAPRAAPRKAPHSAEARPYLLVLGIVLAFAGQAALLRADSSSPNLGTTQAVAGALLVLGAVAFGLGALGTGPTSARLDFERGAQSEPTVPWYQPPAALRVSLALAVVAIGLFLWLGESPVVVGLWLASLVVLFGGQIWGKQIRWPPGLGAEWPYLAGLALVLAVAIVARTYRLSTIPNNFDGDFGSIGLQARDLLTGAQTHIFSFGWATVPMLGYLPTALSMRLLGDNLVGLNASGVALGLLCIIGVYLLGRDLFSARVGLIAAALMTASYAHLAASRVTLTVDPVFFVTFALYFLLRGLRYRAGWALVASAIFSGFCLETHQSGRLLIPLVGCILLFLFIFHRSVLFKQGGWLLLWLLAFLITLGPMLVVFARNSDAFLSHTRDVFILSPDMVNHEFGVYGVNTIPAMLWEQVRHSLLMFYYYGDTSTNLGMSTPYLDPITAPLFTLGIGLAVFQMRRIGASFMLAWVLLGVFLGSFLEGNPPSWTRLMILLPAATLLSAWALDAIYQWTVDSLPGRPGVAWPLRLTVALLLLWIGIRNWHTYVDLKGTYAETRTRIARYLAGQPPAARAYLVTAADWGPDDRTFAFLIPGRLVARLQPEQLQTGITRAGNPTLLILTSEQSTTLAELQQRFPAGITEVGAGNSPGEIAFYAFRLP